MITDEEWTIYTISQLNHSGKVILKIGIPFLLVSLGIYLIKGNPAEYSRGGFVFYLILFVEIFFSLVGIGCFIFAYIYKNNLKKERK